MTDESIEPEMQAPADLEDSDEAELLDILAELRGGTEKRELFQVELEPEPFDPIKKIAAILTRTRLVKDELKIRTDGYAQLNILRGHNFKKPLSMAAIQLMEYVGVGIDQIGIEKKWVGKKERWFENIVHSEGRRRYLAVLTAAENDVDCVTRMALMRIRNAYLVNFKHSYELIPGEHRETRNGEQPNYEDQRFDSIVDLSLPEIAHMIAMQIYSKKIIEANRYNFTIPTEGKIGIPTKFPPNRITVKSEDYQKPGYGKQDVNLSTTMAANLLYAQITGLEDRLQTTKKTFDLLLMIGANYIASQIVDPELRRETVEIMNGPKNLRRAFYTTVMNYQLGLMTAPPEIVISPPTKD
ncbi:hypothetical protein HN587_01980 [Candidatus Woesearchaeota archaeon]|jgi:hypothetical protein|nr:hypothetical protein [Candidatus Woesearchaeota archaeon]